MAWVAVELPDGAVRVLEELVRSGRFSSLGEAINYLLRLFLCGPEDRDCLVHVN
ncbi:MAG: hypothetical protein GXO09_06010 [Crenarchaeota archaeon]|nr:hypothetical protein [Thermoproteota archaeon]